jgi:hypothetical protein
MKYESSALNRDKLPPYERPLATVSLTPASEVDLALSSVAFFLLREFL